jgi:DNA-binding transcriptional ArsR family regulator
LELLAMANQTRATILQRLEKGDLTVGEIAEGLSGSRPAVSQHLRILEKAKLVSEEFHGTRHVYSIDLKGFSKVRVWLDRFWMDALNNFAAEVDRQKMEHPKRCETPQSHRFVRKSRSRGFRNALSEYSPTAWQNGGHSGWWPGNHRERIVIEPKVGGRWIERSTNGTEHDWGRVLVWDPPRRVVFLWQVDLDSCFDPSLKTEVEILFDPIESHATLVSLEHRKLEGYCARASEAAAMFDSPNTWVGLLEKFDDMVGAGWIIGQTRSWRPKCRSLAASAADFQRSPSQWQIRRDWLAHP